MKQDKMKLNSLVIRLCFSLILSGFILQGRGDDLIIPKDNTVSTSGSNGSVPGCQSPLNTAASVERTRQKRHTADHLISDNMSRHIKTNARMQMLSRLLNLAGSSGDGSCRCAPSNAFDIRFRSAAGCKCDTSSMIKKLLTKLHHSKTSIQNTKDPFARYVSRLSDASKYRLRQFLLDEMRRITKQQMLRKIRRRRIQRRLWRRRQMLRKDPGAAFRGKQFLSF